MPFKETQAGPKKLFETLHSQNRPKIDIKYFIIIFFYKLLAPGVILKKKNTKSICCVEQAVKYAH